MNDKQIAQAATKYACMTNGHPGYDPAIHKAFIEGARHVLEHQWIDVNERLPEDDRRVIVCIDGSRFIASYDVFDALWHVEGIGTYERGDVDLWCDMPELPIINPGKEER